MSYFKVYILHHLRQYSADFPCLSRGGLGFNFPTGRHRTLGLLTLGNNPSVLYVRESVSVL